MPPRMAGRCTEPNRIDVRSSVKMLADPEPAHDHAAKASLFEVPIRGWSTRLSRSL